MTSANRFAACGIALAALVWDRIEKSYGDGQIPQRVMDRFYERLEFRRAEQNRAVPHG
jgi:hypothetical protein